MLLLYHGSGSKEVDLVGENDTSRTNILKRQVIRYLEASNSPDAAKFLEDNPVGLWSGTNTFGDAFDLLYLTVGIEEYLKLEIEAQTNFFMYWRIAKGFQALNNPIRFIAVDVSPFDDNAVTLPTLATGSIAVERALRDFESLQKSGERRAELIGFIPHSTPTSLISAERRTSFMRPMKTSLNCSNLSEQITQNSRQVQRLLLKGSCRP